MTPDLDTERLLIVNADDFGLTPGVCDGILRAGTSGVVTSTSALVNAPAFASHAAALRDSGLGVGGHLCLVGEDPPVLSAAEVPTLVESDGSFPLSWRQVVRSAVLGRIDPDDVQREFTAQLEVMYSAGLTLTHLDSHQNLHLWPMVGKVVADLAVERGIAALRVTRSSAVSPVGLGVRSLSAALVARADRHGLRYPEVSTGLDEAGTLDRGRVAGAIERFERSGASSAELATHPGAGPDPDRGRYRWGYQWEEELEALCAPQTRSLIARSGFRLGSFADLSAPVVPRAAARRALAAYGGSGTRARTHTRVRWGTAPLDRVEELVPRRGTVLDIECGHGLFSIYLALRAPRLVRGVDIDADKIALGRTAAARAGVGARVSLDAVDSTWLPASESADAVVINDVLYLLGSGPALRLLDATARAVRPGGVVVIKEIDEQPRWKARLAAIQERAATGVLGVTAGDDVDFVSPAVIEERLRLAGLRVEKHSLDHGYLHPHAAWVATRDETTAWTS